MKFFQAAVVAIVMSAVLSVDAVPGNSCLLPVDPGPCKAYFERFYYNIPHQQCERFIYGGCQGNANNFATHDECVNECEGP